VETCTFAGFNDCVVIRNRDLKVIVTTEVGPRVLFFGKEGGENMFLVRKEHEGLKDGLYHSYGGHRVWVAPEDKIRTSTPDSFPVEVKEYHDGSLCFESRTDEFHIQKAIVIRASGKGFKVSNVIRNHSPYGVNLAPWAVTVMAPGGELLVPIHRFAEQSSDTFAPRQQIVIWPYTTMSDDRWTWGKDIIRLREKPNGSPQKFGTYVDNSCVAYSNAGQSFIKQIPSINGATYTDMGCNFEAYTRGGMLEVESLGSFTESRTHSYHSREERWYLEPEASPSDDDDATEWLRKISQKYRTN
jgi:hypothetical protein